MRSTTLGIVTAAFLINGNSLVDVAPAAKSKGGEAISPNGQPADAQEGKLTDQPARYYIWVDPQGWHLRCAAKKGFLSRFDGTIELSDGEFGRLRPIGLETKNKKTADVWGVDSTRRKIEFKITTSGSFDGFDFTITKAKEAHVSFDLKIGDKPYPARVFVGKDAAHPAELPFSLTVDP